MVAKVAQFALVMALVVFSRLAVGGMAIAETKADHDGATPHPVGIARATAIPACGIHVDAASRGGDGSAAKPLATIKAAVAAVQPGGVVCVAEGTYREEIAPGVKPLTLAGGFQSGQGFRVRDSARFPSRAVGKGGTFIKYVDPAPGSGALTVIDGFDISGYSQAIVRDFYESQRFDLTNNFIHDNKCVSDDLAGAGFALQNVSGVIRGNVFRNNVCGRGGAGFLNDTTNQNTVVVEGNWIDANKGVEAGSAHGGALYLFGNTLKITANRFTGNTVTQWGGGLYVGAYTQGNQPTTAVMTRNTYKDNRAGNSGGGFFCDDGAHCTSRHEIYDGNCGGNVLVDGGSQGSGATIAKFDHVTSINARSADCSAPGIGFFLDTHEPFARDSYSIANSIFWGNGEGQDIATGCSMRCKLLSLAVERSMLQTTYGDGNVKVEFKGGIIAPTNPMFVAPAAGDYRLRDESPLRGKAAGGRDLGARLPVAAAQPAEPPLVAPSAATPKPATQKPATPANVVEPVPAGSPRAAAAGPPGQGGDELSVKDAFDAAKDLNSADGWNAFLQRHPDGFWSDLARAYLEKIKRGP